MVSNLIAIASKQVIGPSAQADVNLGSPLSPRERRRPHRDLEGADPIRDGPPKRGGRRVTRSRTRQARQRRPSNTTDSDVTMEEAVIEDLPESPVDPNTVPDPLINEPYFYCDNDITWEFWKQHAAKPMGFVETHRLALEELTRAKEVEVVAYHEGRVAKRLILEDHRPFMATGTRTLNLLRRLFRHNANNAAIDRKRIWEVVLGERQLLPSGHVAKWMPDPMYTWARLVIIEPPRAYEAKVWDDLLVKLRSTFGENGSCLHDAYRHLALEYMHTSPDRAALAVVGHKVKTLVASWSLDVNDFEFQLLVKNVHANPSKSGLTATYRGDNYVQYSSALVDGADSRGVIFRG